MSIGSFTPVPMTKNETTRRSLPKVQFVLSRTRGRRTRFFYGEKLGDCIDHAKLRNGETFLYVKLVRDGVGQCCQAFEEAA